MARFDEWCAHWGPSLPPEALIELLRTANPTVLPIPGQVGTEAELQAQVILAASRDHDTALWRNNNGAVTTDDGRHIRFGLGNQSSALNAKWKSSDLIGIRRPTGQFVAVEVKTPGWTLRPSDKHGHAQAAFHQSVRLNGGVAGFVQSLDDLRRLLA